ncbi:hypothetical protein ACFVXW_00380 [Streptomyces sp. NPDC058251]|uniref:hypothetical protein n=1 Tax=Streptomyces sp. NPDC058251 TaxID=3346404 RepID=UPI0036E7CBC7
MAIRDPIVSLSAPWPMASQGSVDTHMTTVLPVDNASAFSVRWRWKAGTRADARRYRRTESDEWGAMPRLRRPNLPEGPEEVLNAALHDLHLRAGLPSVRDLVARVGGDDVAGRSRIHDVFSSERLPTWGLVQILVEALVRTIPDADPRAEERRLHQLWLAASGQAVVDTSTASASRHAEPPREVTRQERVGRRQLVMRVEWTTPTDLNATLRRSIRDHVSLALKDIGQQPQGRHRVDSSAGSTIVLQRRHEPPGLTAATFLSTLEEEFLQSTWPEFNPFDDNIGSSTIRFLAHYDEAAPSSRDAVMDLNRIGGASDYQDRSALSAQAGHIRG